MATSADNLSKIINILADKYKFDYSEALEEIAKGELLPKKLLPKNQGNDTPYASKKSEEFAIVHNVSIEGHTGTGKDGRFTISDLKKLLEKPTTEKLLVSPTALNLANENKISLVGIQGTGTNGRILVKDVQEIIDSRTEPKDELNISPRALQEAHNLGITDEELRTIQGSGTNGRVLLEDIKKHASSSEDKSDSSDEEEEEE